jgi:hypothetical protein
MQKILSALIALSLGVTYSAFGQEKISKPQQKRSTAQPSSRQKIQVADSLAKYAHEPFDPAGEVLPAGYRGHSCREITRILKLSNPQKDEFESSTAYKERVAHLESDVLYGSITGSSIVAFTSERPVTSVTYNADTEGMQVTYFTSGSLSTRVGSNFVQSVLVESRITDSKEYVGENGYGKKVNVHQTSHSACAVAFSNVNTITRQVTLPHSFFFKVPADYARTLKENIGVLYVGTIKAPFLAQYVNYIKPTIDNPTELIYSGDAVVIQLSKIVLYDITTGKMLSTTDL